MQDESYKYINNWRIIVNVAVPITSWSSCDVGGEPSLGPRARPAAALTNHRWRSPGWAERERERHRYLNLVEDIFFILLAKMSYDRKWVVGVEGASLSSFMSVLQTAASQWPRWERHTELDCGIQSSTQNWRLNALNSIEWCYDTVVTLSVFACLFSNQKCFRYFFFFLCGGRLNRWMTLLTF